LIYKYFELATRLTPNELKVLKNELEEPSNNPRNTKRKLGYELVKLYYDEEIAKSAIEEFDRIFIKKEIPDEIEEYKLQEKNIKIVDLLTVTKLTDSKGNARRLVEQGGVSIDGEKVEDINYIVDFEKEIILKVGKRKFLKIIK
jgi:tyrosyl-tRNA synthetase